MPAFTGQLRSNEIFAALFNMIISQEVFADNIAGTYGELVDEARVDGSLYGDTKLYYSTDALKSHAWGADSEATNLLAIARPKAPETQAIVLDVFRQIDLTVDDYLSKRAWGNEGAFSSFNSIMLGWIRNTKRIYDSTTYNAYIGTAVSLANRATVSVPVSTLISSASTQEEANRLTAEGIAETVADLFVDLKDVSRDFNDYEHIRSYNESDLKVVWNSKWVNKIRKVDLPTIFHKDGLIEKFEERILPARYFGTVVDATTASGFTYNASTNPTGPLTDSSNDLIYTYRTGGPKVRALVEQEVTVSGTTYHLFAGDELPASALVYDDSASEFVIACYVEDANVIAIVMHNRSVPFMSAFEVGTSFFNGKSLTTNHYLTWGHNTIEYLKGKPFIRVVAA